MKHFLIAILFLIAAPQAAVSAPMPQAATPSLEISNAPGEEILLTSDRDVADAARVGSALDMLRNNARACIVTRQAGRAECQCKSANSLGNLKSAYNRALSLHPDWDGKAVSFKKGTSAAVKLSFITLKNQLETCARMEK